MTLYHITMDSIMVGVDERWRDNVRQRDERGQYFSRLDVINFPGWPQNCGSFTSVSQVAGIIGTCHCTLLKVF